MEGEDAPTRVEYQSTNSWLCTSLKCMSPMVMRSIPVTPSGRTKCSRAESMAFAYILGYCELAPPRSWCSLIRYS